MPRSSLTRNTLGLALIYVMVLGGFALWQREEIAAAHGMAGKTAQLADGSERAMRRLALGAFATLALVGACGLAAYALLVRRSREVAELLEGALAGRTMPVPQVKDEFAVAFAAAGRVGQELHLERDRGAQARERLDALSHLMDVGVLLVNVSRQLEFANARACALLGCADVAEVERRWGEIRGFLAPVMGSVDPPAAQLDLDVPGRRGVRALTCRVYPMGDGEHQVFIFLLRDRVMVDALETDLLLASQLRALSRVYRAVTHDLKAPLNAMVLNLDLLQSALRRGHNGDAVREAEDSEQYLGILREELERLDRSLLALLAETTPAGRSREEFDAGAMVREIERLLLPQARLQHVALEAHLPGTAVRIAGQRDRLKQAILNVAINALEAMSEGGALELRLEALADRAEVLITDSGPGIPEELHPRIFDLHFTTKTSGTGIGLYVARSIVEAHGGEISVANAPGKGSSFRLRLPALGYGA